MGANNPNYQVIATDYTSYAVVYSCTNLFFTNISKFFLRNWHIKAQCVKGLLHRCLNGAIGRSLMFVCSSLFLKVAMTNIIKRVEGLYCKRPIQCLASSEILTPHPLTARRVCTSLPMVWGEEILAGWRGGGGSIVRKTLDTALYSLYVSAS
jgi:hypothetical protein